MRQLTSILKVTAMMILLCAFSINGFSQLNKGIINGTVVSDYNSNALKGATISITNDADKNMVFKTTSDDKGAFEIKDVPAGKYYFRCDLKGYDKYRKSHVEVEGGKTKTLKVIMKMPVVIEKDQPVVDLVPVESESIDKSNSTINRSYSKERKKMSANYSFSSNSSNAVGGSSTYGYKSGEDQYHNTESYAAIDENGFKSSTADPLSTFSVDVDAASYSNCRRFILAGTKPDKGAVRVEEMINYFNYDYPDPVDGNPFSITTEVGDCPWSENKLVHIGLQGKRIDKKEIANNNLVFLLDVSGSMNYPNKLPLLKKSFRMLVDELDKDDRVAIVVYAGAAGLVLKSTPASKSTEILESLENLRAGGSTAGGEGIKLAYKVAKDNFIQGGNNRVILATDGDFNVGMSSDAAMQELIEEKRKTGIFLTCLGFGTGNYKDSKMEILADKGNGNYAYIDNLLEAKKVLVTEMGATLNTIAKDVKIQVEFNPSIIESYRLVGYENRLLNNEDFNDDTKDAGEIGAGHSVTALYEVVLKGQGTEATQPKVDPLKYQTQDVSKNHGNEMLTVKFRYKAPDGDTSKLLERVLENKITAENKLSENFNFSAAVAEFGMLLRDSEHKGTASFDHVLAVASKNMGGDKNGYRAEFLKLVDAAKVVYN
ncbi:von Willebrand factor type A domain-containing protein [Paracrocinitomix mangrovi]|uniref:YfbK domain-containing protein n=1 Tax=Paracrocinitomix mangrovi TaxID=2862509 RepID=UPI001C8D0FF7|nr:von Willebrand factor type A domain-containing protein [Paracrocinitomix mangrovi]UKN02804.1 von Willebrand factor type A domain-containing protein [Paracrocinitomix mangrovi]